MNPEDPVEKLQRYYSRLHQLAIPITNLTPKVRWWEVAGGLATGAAAVVFAVSLCLSSPGIAPAQGGHLLEQQMRSAGLSLEPELPPRRAQGDARWAI
jgi:hypothetical protein